MRTAGAEIGRCARSADSRVSTLRITRGLQASRRAATRSSGSSAEDALADDVGDQVAVQSAPGRKQRPAGSSRLPMIRGAPGAGRRAGSLSCVSIRPRFSSTTTICSSRWRKRAHPAAPAARPAPHLVARAARGAAPPLRRGPDRPAPGGGRDRTCRWRRCRGGHPGCRGSVRSRRLARAKARTASQLVRCRRSSWPSARVGPADVEAVRRQRDSRRAGGRWLTRPGPASIEAAVSTVSWTHLSADPAAAVARQGEAVEAEVEDLGDAGRVEDRDHGVDQGVLALVRGGRATRRCDRRPSAPARRHAAALPARLPWRNTSPDRSTPGPLPYQMPNTPSWAALAVESACWVPQSAVAARSSLTARAGRPRDRHRRSAWPPPELLVEPAQRRAAIAGDVARGVEARRQVALALHHRQPDQRLDAGQEDPTGCSRMYLSSRLTAASVTTQLPIRRRCSMATGPPLSRAPHRDHG